LIHLPERPRSQGGDPVAAWSEPVLIPSYDVKPADRNPMFLEKRVYQGSSGRVYPNPVIDQVSDERRDRQWDAVHLENQYVRLMVLPGIGGRIHIGMDRTSGYDFFYRQNVIKPALVGLLGPWISGGVEFNWPQHHRPSTFMPVDWAIEELPDGGRTIWCSEHEPMGRMKGMHGVTLRPGSAAVELRVRLFNRTPDVRTFLWWANVAARVHDRYQSFFPPDVAYVADHAKRAMSSFPVSRSRYYGIEYGERRPEDADLSWYRNIPVPTSYMVTGTARDFFGGYDHAADAGFVHWADHRISPGKKQWTWGNGEFGYAWDRELTDADGPYVELMAGVYTDNQPDFSFLAPYETRTFSQYWYPVQRIGPAHEANLDAAVSLTVRDGRARIGVAVTADRPGAVVRLAAGDPILLEQACDLAPGHPLVIEDVPVPAAVSDTDLLLSVSAGGRELITYQPPRADAGEAPSPAKEPPLPAEVTSAEELYLTGLHLEQYRHATRRPEDYWREGLQRQPGDARCNAAMGWWYLRRGEFEAAAGHFQRAIATLTRLNPNPYDGDPLYGLGLALVYAGRLDEADEAFGKAGWNEAWRGPAGYARAQLAARHGRIADAVTLLGGVIERDAGQHAARTLRAALCRRLGQPERASADIAAVLAADPLDAWALDQRRLLSAAGPGQAAAETATGWPEPRAGAAAPQRAPDAHSRLARRSVPDGALPGGAQTALDVAHDYAAAGLLDEAIDVVHRQLAAPGPDPDPAGPAHPLLRYTLGWLLARAGDDRGSAEEFRRAAAMAPGYCFPARLEEIEILETAMSVHPADTRAPYYLGNLLYDRRRYREAIAAWRRAARLDPAFPTVHRNLGIAEFNNLGRPARARAAYQRAVRADPADARVLYEFDQLRRRLNEPPASRLRLLEHSTPLVQQRDDLTVEFVTLLNELGRHDEALAVISGRRFHPWEGGEGLVSAQWVLAHVRLAQAAIEAGDPDRAAVLLEKALTRPDNLGEGKSPLEPENEIHYHLGLAHRAAGRDGDAGTWLKWAAAYQGDKGAPAGEAAYWRALAMRALGDEAGATALLEDLLRSARRRARQPQRIDYFATSLPTFLIFEDDLDLRNRTGCRYLEGLALAGLGRGRAAVAVLRDVLDLDVDHAGAAWQLHALTAGSVRERS
jgi:tetratricopeptide (TPR) repeat protein